MVSFIVSIPLKDGNAFAAEYMDLCFSAVSLGGTVVSLHPGGLTVVFMSPLSYLK